MVYYHVELGPSRGWADRGVRASTMEDDASGAAMRAQSLELVLATNESITIDLRPLPSPDELEVVVDVLVEEKPPAYFWTALAARCWNAERRAEAELIVARGCAILPVHRPEESVPLFALQAAFHLTDARAAPKQVLSDARYQSLGERAPKQHYFRQAVEALNRAQSLNPQHPMMLQARAAFALATGDNALATRLFDVLLSRVPTNPVALLGRACVQLRARAYLAALHSYQAVLRIALRLDQLAAARKDASLRWVGADARIGIGLCLWGLGRMDAALRAWRRAAAARPDAAVPHLLLGLALTNAARQPTALAPGFFGAYTEQPEDAARRAAYADGIVHLQTAWQREKSAMAAVALAAHVASQATHALAGALPGPMDMTHPARAVPADVAAAAETSLARALKLGEHAVQFADAKSVVVHAWLQHAHALHLASRLPQHAADHEMRVQSQRYYARALDELSRDDSLSHGLAAAVLGLAQLQAASGDARAAVNTLDAVLGRPLAASGGGCAVELMLMSGLLLAAHAPGAETAQIVADERRARVALDRVLRVMTAAQCVGQRESEDAALTPVRVALEGEQLAPMTLKAIARLGDDPRVHATLARLWGSDMRATEQYEAALALVRADDDPLLAAQLHLNAGALLARGTASLRAATAHLERALHVGADGDDATAVKLLANYNLGRAAEKRGDAAQAQSAYAALLAAHPAYVDARVRVAVLAAAADGARDTANQRFKDALSCDPANLDARAEYMRFLAGAYPANRHAAWGALKDTAAQLFLGPDAGARVFGSAAAARRAADVARRDAYTLGALGWAYYQLGLHAPPGADRAKSMLRAADLLDKALAAEPHNVFAAQGLAILLADDALGDAAGDEARRRAAADDAAALFGRLREVRDDASVYVCQGHAFMLTGALERALHVYDLALTRYGHARDPAVLQYAARAAYALGLKERQFGYLRQAIAQLDAASEVLAERHGSAATAAEIERRQIAYNRAVMAQKALQMLYDLPDDQRRSAELAEAIGWVEAAQPVLASLVEAAQQKQLAYITPEVVEQRAKYADMSLLRQAAEQLDEARRREAAEREQLARLDEKQRAKQARLEELRREKEEEHRRRAEVLAESRRRAREEAAQIEYVQEPEPEVKKRQPRKKKQRDDFVVEEDAEGLFEESSEDEGEAGAEGDGEAEDEGDGEAEGDGDGEAEGDGEAAADEAPDASDNAPTNPMRARLEALARQRRERAANEQPKKRRGDKPSRQRDVKKAKVDA